VSWTVNQFFAVILLIWILVLFVQERSNDEAGLQRNVPRGTFTEILDLMRFIQTTFAEVNRERIAILFR